ncbi:uncharacterized protein LOC106714408 [Papilio machaon]|uniref:uncharacterized protein LOC106714408 n=1 Tax=Papilio machaon TaxID=76193 RepID=UPI001E664290|nr:uncharacterized protein LOC106714408 [Papilio machaon]
MEETTACQLRRRRLANNPNIALTFELGYQVKEGKVDDETPSPSSYKYSTYKENMNSALQEFRSKQQSFEIQIEECEEEEIIISDDEDETEAGPSGVDRPVTPTPVQDFGTSVVYTEGPQACDFLKVKTYEHDCPTDVSDADDDEE